MNPFAFLDGLPAAIAVLLGAAALLAGARLLWGLARLPARQRPGAWRIALLLVLQCACAWLLYRTLFPPGVQAPAGLLVIATAEADRVVPGARPPGATFVALPEAPALAGAVRAPDLATALRRHPGTSRLQVLGAGLVPRDLDAAHGLAVEFHPAPLPRGLVALWPPRGAQAGRAFEVGGRVHGLPGGAVELLDPGGRRVARAALAEDGHFRLTGQARDPGPATWRLRTHDRAGRQVDDAAVPLEVAPGARLRVLALAGGPDPELKYLRRWASDADLALEARIALGPAMDIGDGPARLDPAMLAGYDLVVLDARSWQALGARRAPLLQAVDNGLGLLLQLPGATAPSERAALRSLGFATAVERAREVALPAPAGADLAGTTPAPLTLGPLRLDGDAVVPLLRAADGAPLAGWRAHGLGRIGVATFDDSYRLVLAGDGARHGDLWATLFSTLARARAQPSAQPDDDQARVGQRLVLCGLPASAMVEAPDGRRVRIYVDPAGGARACAGFWPRVAGWHALRADDATQRFHVRTPDDAPGLRAARLRADSARLVGAAATAVAGPGPAVPGPRWPWFLAWLAATAAGWWFERSRLGRAAPPAG